MIGNVNDSKNKKNGETGAAAKSLEKSHLCTGRRHVSPGDIDSNVTTPGRTRTCDLRIRNPLQNAVTPCKQGTPKNDLTNTRQNHKDTITQDPDLAKIIEAWPQLSNEIRKAISRIIS